MNECLYMLFISCLPRKRVGRLIGSIAGWEGSHSISRFAVRHFASRFGINTNEASQPIDRYPNLQSFFVRRLQPGARPVDPAPDAVVSPVDGILAEHGSIDGNTCLQVKGRTYEVDELLGGVREATPFRNGYFITIYLSPRHYHRIHTPVTGDVVRYHHIPGHLFPVNPPSVRRVDRLFAVNERVISYIRLNRTASPEIALVKVGAIGVGRISVNYLDRVSNRPGQSEREERLYPGHHLERGEELAAFELGSTVILLFPPGLITPDLPSLGEELRMGERIATLSRK